MGARIGLLDRDFIAGCGVHLDGEGVPRLKVLVSQVAENVAVEIVAAALGHDVDNTAGRAAELGVIVADNQLKLLHIFLRHGGADSVHRIVHGVRAVHGYFIRPRALPAEIQSAGGSRADGR